MQIKYIDGIRLQKAVHAGINHVINRKDYLNKINVFPVPDGDTGTNMAYTLSTIANEIKSTSFLIKLCLKYQQNCLRILL